LNEATWKNSEARGLRLAGIRATVPVLPGEDRKFLRLEVEQE
jgi:hypothetical protein